MFSLSFPFHFDAQYDFNDILFIFGSSGGRLEAGVFSPTLVSLNEGSPTSHPHDATADGRHSGHQAKEFPFTFHSDVFPFEGIASIPETRQDGDGRLELKGI